MSDDLPPLIFPATSQAERRRHALLKKQGLLRQIGPRLHTSLPADRVALAVRNNWSLVVSTLYPGALISYRTALEYTPSPEGVVFLTSTTNRVVTYPGLTLELVRGPAPLDDDPPFRALRASSLPRALLENLSINARRARPRTVPAEQLEHRLDQLLTAAGEDELNKLRDRAAAIAARFGWRAELARLDGIIGALLGTRPARHVTSALARARAAGAPYDAACLGRLHALVGELRTRVFSLEPDVSTAPAHVRHKAFFEAYFSNFIEGTTFEVEEAERIVFDRQIPAARPTDAHDIRGTFEIVSDADEMRRTPSSPAALLDLLRDRHSRLMAERPEAGPGALKTTTNRAGNTTFVAPSHVIGTLQQGFELYRDLPEGLPRAIFLMFLVSDVHPFLDGNGRVARIMMNAELVTAGTSTIIIPNSFRDHYLTALRALTRRDRPGPLVDTLVRAATFSRLDFTEYRRILAELQQRAWFVEPDEGTPLVGALARLARPREG